MMEFNNLLKNEADKIHQVLRQKLSQIDTDHRLLEAVEYAVLSRGKRIRPILLKQTLILAGDETSISSEVLEPLMAALELIHCYSLVHDDLPGMDNSEYRSGLLTVHKKYSEGIAVLVGDALLNTAAELAFQAVLADYGNVNIVKAVQTLFQKAGISGMIRGQFVDLDTFKERDIDTLMELTDLKTCALMEASMVMGAYLAGCSQDRIKKTERLAKYIGMLFQIQDDILDYDEDLQEKKLSFATYFGMDKSEEYKKGYKTKALDLVAELGEGNLFFVDFIDYLCNRKK